MAYAPLDKPIDPYGSVDKLSRLGLDPIAKAVEFIEQIDLDIACMMFDSEGKPKNYSQVAYAQLMATGLGLAWAMPSRDDARCVQSRFESRRFRND
jgi:hypothetical protein